MTDRTSHIVNQITTISNITENDNGENNNGMYKEITYINDFKKMLHAAV